MKLLLKILYLVIAFKIVDLSLFSFSSYILKNIPVPIEDDYGSLARLYRGDINTDICFFGSSRTYLHINPEVIEEEARLSCWNLGMDGSNLEQHFFTLREYVLHNKKPGLIFMEAEIQSLDPSKLTFKKHLFKPYQQFSSHTRELFHTGWRDRIVFSLVKIYSFKNTVTKIGRAVLFRAGKNYSEKSRNTKAALHIDNQEIVFVKGAHLKKNSRLENLIMEKEKSFTPSEERKELYQKIVDFCRAENIRVVFFSSPRLTGEIKKEDHEYASSFFSSLAASSPDAYYIDFTWDSQFQNDITLWYNNGHLNEKGAGVFSRRIAAEVSRLFLQ